CLLAGIAGPDHGVRTARTLLAEDSFSGWGIRTIATSEARYNPMSYHNGSVWPHDNALIAAGMAHYGHKQGVLRILTGLFDASLFPDPRRLRARLRGFPGRRGESPSLCPSACGPHPWASPGGFLLFPSCLGPQIAAPRRRLSFGRPVLPSFLEQVELRNI